MVLLVVLAAGCAGGHQKQAPARTTRTAEATAPTMPRLPTSAGPYSVTRFPCPKHPGTTIDFETCSGRRVLALNARVNHVISIVWRRLGSAIGRRYFANSERAWQSYVRNECTSRSRGWVDPTWPHQYVGGTLAPVLYGQCEEELTASRLRELKETAALLGPH
jgi:uncharacterized protein YecT (DUF1311 family)